jgi:hypothetical protein
MCLVHLEDDMRPSFSSESALMLSWKIMNLSMSYPWHSMKYRIHIMPASLLANEISSVSVELFVLHFIMLDELETAPRPNVTRPGFGVIR